MTLSLRKILIVASVICFGALLILVNLYLNLSAKLPQDVRTAIIHQVQQAALPSSIVDRHGQSLGVISEQSRYPIKLRSLSKNTINAFLAAEDIQFYDHIGISFSGIFRSFLVNLSKNRLAQGGSTITQQVVRQHLLKRERTLERKISEVILAIKLESKISKDEILELWLNSIYFGNNSYGIEAASRNYFGKNSASLTLNEAAILAGIPQAPSRYAPHINNSAANLRRTYVLEQMRQKGLISQKVFKNSLLLKPRYNFARHKTESAYPWITESVKNELQKSFELSGISRTGLKIETHIDKNFQNQLEIQFQKLMKPHINRGLESSILAIDATSGKTIGIIGGMNFKKSQFNRSFQMKRPVGTTLSPILFGLALDQGNLTTNAGLPLSTFAVNSKFQEMDEVAQIVTYPAIRSFLETFGISTGSQFYIEDIKASPWNIAQAWRSFLGRPGSINTNLINSISGSSTNNPFHTESMASRKFRGLSPEAAYSVETWMKTAGFKSSKHESVRFQSSTGWDFWDIAVTKNIIVVAWGGIEEKPISKPIQFLALKNDLSKSVDSLLNYTGAAYAFKRSGVPKNLNWHLIKLSSGDSIRLPFPSSKR
ncbi:MAG: transglycosylase domain-containing protein [Proteobacteria bacterium]|nr:transglycosylase domain-containing protein [Pseudomonadota bacterium]